MLYSLDAELASFILLIQYKNQGSKNLKDPPTAALTEGFRQFYLLNRLQQTQYFLCYQNQL